MFKRGSPMRDDVLFTVDVDSPGEYFGIELDGNQRYVMENDYVTYNSNGKSATVDLLQNTLGDYAGVLPVNVLTKKRGNSGEATPELADKKGKRFLSIQEPEHNDVIYVGQMKELVAGNDRIAARALYENPIYYNPQFKLALICNKLPEIPSDDGGTWRRIRVTPWTSMFVDDPKKPGEYKKDTKLSDKMKSWGPAFAWYVLNKYYPMYKLEGLIEPDTVTMYTDRYKMTSDFYYEFFTDCTNTTGKDDDVVRLDVMYTLFKKWYGINYSAKPPPKKELKSYLQSKQTFVLDGSLVKGIELTES